MKLEDDQIKDNQEFIDNMLQQQHRIKEQQDQRLGGVHKAIERVHEIALTMNDELEEQDQYVQ